MSKCLLAPRLVVPLLACVSFASVSILAQPSHQPAPPDVPPGGIRLLEAGQPYVQVHPTVEAVGKYHAAHGGGARTTTKSKLLSYHGGTGGIGVETAPKVYLVMWGSQWANDPSGEALILENFFDGVGGSHWLNSVTQYCQGVATGSVSCINTGTPAGNQPGIFGGLLVRRCNRTDASHTVSVGG